MPSFLPDPDTATPYPGAPRFFKRYWDETGGLNAPLWIYGYSCRSTYEEDWPVEDDAWARRRAFPSISFSSVEREGEYGFQPLRAVQEISRLEFIEAAREGRFDVKCPPSPPISGAHRTPEP